MKIRWKLLIICIAIPLIIGGISAFATMSSMEDFAALEKPPLSPPGWLFPVVWSILYTLMGIASYLVITSGEAQKHINTAITFYAVQLIFNFFWSFFFFNLKLYFFSFAWLIVLWLLIIATLVLFSRVSKTAGYLLIPYLLWVSFAAYLNLGIALLN
ncbi:MAG: tryptophan-rich sensory protein [Clostridia bacterium]|nr:tryptophan-rich sensory protein [Clostridia bacterium]